MKILSEKIGVIFSKIIPSPNAWTTISLFFAAFGFWSLLKNNLLIGLILFLIAGLFDKVDGLVARTLKKETPLGAFLDGVIDRYVETFLFLGLFLYVSQAKADFSLMDCFWFFLLIFGSLMTPFIKAYADHRKLITDPDKLDKMKGFFSRAIRLGLIYFGMLFSLFYPDSLMSFIIVIAILSNLAVLQRIRLAIKLI
ncbi:MAG: hypothetical protein A2175_01625 [Candidatus Nealsonbacteria bacterium RBG_13_42_11]|uniref:CDP-alcohol phosphatidyltransferase n=1 Tax=Candidatus Nealsonbacteria bacterium RBG_13_42_11 TaxID=1801663 RepID=A0A1G2E1G4_9BACT|nr:MAG: hypothetical protein A2175_01625 [Candidatus Nealsonbacteria bacterium RBG_13_42_11]